MKIRTATIGALINNETSRMTPISTQQLFADLFVIQDSFANIFLIKTNDGYIAIDAGIDPATIKQELEKLKISPDEVKTVLLTHSDIDHVNGTVLFSHADIYLSEAEIPMLGKHRVTMTEADLQQAEQMYATCPTAAGGLFGDAEFWPEEDIHVFEEDGQRKVSLLKTTINGNLKTLRDGQSLDIGGTKIKAVLIAGHTTGQMAYIINDQYIFVGDGMSLKDGQAAPFNAFLNLDEKHHRQSISKIRELKHYNHLFTQHYGYTSNIRQTFENWSE